MIEVVTPKEAALALRCSVMTVYRLMRRGKLTGYAITDQIYRIDRRSLQRALTERTA